MPFKMILDKKEQSYQGKNKKSLKIKNKSIEK